MKSESTRDLAAWGILAVAACAALWRAPIVWWEPRFWGEEGALYFAYARQQGVLASLFFIPTSGFPAGYLLLAASLPATLASFVSLELAPRVTTFCAFLVQLAPMAVVLFGSSPLWRRNPHRLLACAVLVFSPAVVGEVWLNTINSQVFCGLTAALILVSEAPDGRLGRIFRGLLLFCGLSGPYTSFLAPIFWLRTRLEHGAEAVVQWRIVATAAVLQASIFLWTTFTFPLAPERFESGRWALRVAAAAYHFVVRSLFGETLGLRIADWLGLRQPLGSIADAYWLPVTPPAPAEQLAAGWIALAVMVAVLGWLGRAHPRAHLLTAALVLSGVLITFSIGHLYAAGRYAVVPGTLLLLRVAVAAWSDGPAWRRWSAGFVLATGLLAGLLGFRTETPPGVFGLAPGRPSWTQEVATWRDDPGYGMRIWAYNLDVPNRLTLLPAPADGADLRAFEAPRFQLTSTGDWSTHRLPIVEVPEDFRLTFDFETSRPVGDLEVELRWEGRGSRPAAVWKVKRCAVSQICRVTLERLDVISSADWDGRSLHGLEIAMRSKPAQPARLVATRLRVARRLEGALEALVAPRRSTAQEGGRSTRLAGEVTALAMAESWRLDGDFSFDGRDLERLRQRSAPGIRLDLKKEGDRLAYRGSHLHALAAGTVTGGRESQLTAMNLAAALVILVWAARRGVVPALSIPLVLASWAGVALFSAGPTWVLTLVLWIGLASFRGEPGGTMAAGSGVLAALMCLDSPIFVPLALLAGVGRFLPRRELRPAALSLLVSLLCLAIGGSLLARAGGLPWWSAGERVVLAREALAPDEQRPLVIPEAGAEQRGITAAEPLWAIPDTFYGPLFAYPLLVLWGFAWIRSRPRGDSHRLERWLAPAAVVTAAGLAWFLSPASRAGPQAWAILYPLLLMTPFSWPRGLRRGAQVVSVLWILSVLRVFL